MAQAALPREYGIEGFCYYHYGLAGKRILERPVSEIITSGEPDFPFCLCCANHSWNSAAWQGTHRELITQIYPDLDDHAAHFDWLVQAFRDPRYLRVDGKPIFVLYKPDDIPDVAEFACYSRHRAQQAGLPGLYQIGVSHRDERTIRNSEEIMPILPVANAPEWEDYPFVLPNWDNTPRADMDGLVFANATPKLFRKLLRQAIHRVPDRAAEHRLIFLKAWNECAEGNHVEPDLQSGPQWLEVIRDELN